MKYKQTLQILSIILVLASSILIIACSKQENPDVNYDNLAKCLTEKNVVMYGTTWCSHCQNQKKMFGSSFQYATFVDCDIYKDDCINAGVEGYPTWKINGSLYPGEQSTYFLAKKAGCVDQLA